MPNSEPPPMQDPETWAQRFDDLVGLVRHNADVARDAATSAAVKVTAENTRSQQKIKRELLARQDEDRVRQDALHTKVEDLGKQMNEVLVTLNKLSTTKLLQIAITALILAALVVIGINALGG